MFGRPRQGLLGAIVALQVVGLLGGGGDMVEDAHPAEDMQVRNENQVFSPQWVEELSRHKLGCEMGRGLYTWRDAGFGSNINNLLNSWVYGLVVEEGWIDLAVMVDNTQLPRLECSKESGGLASRGWSCLFTRMPHICIFSTTSKWKRHLTSAGVSGKDLKEADRISRNLDVIRLAHITNRFVGLEVDQRGAKAAMAKFLWSYRTPWLLEDVHAVTHVRETFERAPFVGIHIRRGDKIWGRGIRFRHDVEKYLTTAVSHLGQEPNGTSVDSIKGIWVASDDANVVRKVRNLAGAYFPNVRSEDIVFANGGAPGVVQRSDANTYHSNIQGYGSFVYLMADLEQLAAADLFVGTCSSNLGRLVMVLRDGLGKDRKSAVSLDIPWAPTRGRRLAQD